MKREVCSHDFKMGGSLWGDNKCPICGKIERRYFLGSWDWKPQKCKDCTAKEIEKKLNTTRDEKEKVT